MNRTDMRTEGRAGTERNQPGSEPRLWQRLAELGGGLGAGWHSVRGAGPDLYADDEPATQGAAEIVEGDGDLRVRDVGEPEPSGFRYFLDGIEHARVAGYLGTIPIVYGYVAAVVRERRDRGFNTWGVEEREVVAVPYSHVSKDRMVDAGFPEESLLDSASEALHPLQLAEAGRQAVKRKREQLEVSLAHEWMEETADDGWLLLDGGLAIAPRLLRCGRAAGLVKSHRTQFLPAPGMADVLAMGRGERSSIFRPVRPDVGEVFSWYLRLRPTAGQDIYWALARIETSATDASLEIADRVSRWLLDETAPLAMPDHRWDVLLYPIRDCEMYLRARMPILGVE